MRRTIPNPPPFAIRSRGLAARIAACVLAAAAGRASVADEPRAADATLAPSASLDLTTPSAPIPRGREVATLAGALRIERDFVLMIDRSLASGRASGRDVDGDGRTGRMRDGRVTDPDDRILDAEREAARALLAALDERSARSAVLSVAGDVDVLSSLGAPERSMEALASQTAPARLADCAPASVIGRGRVRAFPARVVSGCTPVVWLTGALDVVSSLLFERGGSDARRLATAVLLWSGSTPIGGKHGPRRSSLATAMWLRNHAVAVHVVDFTPPDERRRRCVAREIAALTGGRVVDAHASDYLAQVAALAATPVERLSLRNLSNGTSGSTRVDADASGGVSGDIPVAPGENRIELRFDLVGPAQVVQVVRVERESGS